ncbi:ABC transporter permease [Oscillochloris sp. ZM17-4]|uniref:ABC transporter permease n=1 Tax=Oscillochloris sp. ZM17-4 TaxID=2866714 RepID=UPI001C72A0D7|nr:ABC transporter permease [Oscillochloris sp. ZM17-4]MBX0327261.1 ABC transporter permease [Oscillochloris sp. ZM17-4]
MSLLRRPELLIGGALVALMAICAVAAPLLAPFDPIKPVVLFDGADIVRAPYPPGTAGMLLGSDSLRRDLLSRLIYGTRYTLLFCGVAAMLRVALAAGLGMLAGWYAGASRLLDVLAGAWSAVPSLFFALIPLALISRLGNNQLNALAFVVVFSLTGWPETAVRVRVAVRELRAAPFVESAYAIGLGRAAVLWRHIRPNLRDLLLVEAAYAVAAVLLLCAELGFLGIFIGGAEREAVGGQISNDPIFAEWGGMLAKGVRERGASAVLFIAPMAAFSLSILAFNLLAEGLRRRQ